jgi:hypothetical protein
MSAIRRRPVLELAHRNRPQDSVFWIDPFEVAMITATPNNQTLVLLKCGREIAVNEEHSDVLHAWLAMREGHEKPPEDLTDDEYALWRDRNDGRSPT